MSNAFPPRPRTLGNKSPASYAIVASKFNEPFVQSMVDHAHAELNALDPESPVVLLWTPGSFEIPLFVQSALELKRFDAVLALGVILQGETAHAALIADAVTKALLDLSLKHRTPVVHEVLLLQNEDQARERCLGSTHNRGTEAARAAVSATRKLSEIA
jgi:6,7-dimethyl-8-ribityllumazine synthase